MSSKLNTQKMRNFCLILVAFLIGQTGLQAKVVYSTPLNAQVIENNSVISWSTLTEKNNDFFVLERSRDGITFEQAAKLQGAGASNEVKKYRFVDIAPEFSRTFYRLLQVDYEGEVNISHIVVVTRKMEESHFDLTAMSGTVTDRYFSVVIESDKNNTLSYRVMTQLGDIKKEGSSKLIAGTNAISIDLDGLDVATYQFALKVGNEIEVLNIQKTNSLDLPEINLATKNKQN